MAHVAKRLLAFITPPDYVQVQTQGEINSPIRCLSDSGASIPVIKRDLLPADVNAHVLGQLF